ncbi:hypothetical protein PhaR5_120 [Acinetobacter phage PhaR5]|nr:hypothetical protein PhaR5_120 [Acinetobacter phage PhaR5]
MKDKDIELIIKARKALKQVVKSVRDDPNASKADIQLSFIFNQMQLEIKHAVSSRGMK